MWREICSLCRESSEVAGKQVLSFDHDRCLARGDEALLTIEVGKKSAARPDQDRDEVSCTTPFS